MYMATKTTINLDDEMEAALAELVEFDGTKTLAIKRSLLAEVKRRRRSQAMTDMIASWEAAEGPIDQEHLDWAAEPYRGTIPPTANAADTYAAMCRLHVGDASERDIWQWSKCVALPLLPGMD